MNLKKRLYRQIRGWLPKEANSPSCQQATTRRFFPTHKAKVAYVMLVVGAGFVGALLGALGYVLGISSRFGIMFWPIITGMIIGIGGALIYGKIYRKEHIAFGSLVSSIFLLIFPYYYSPQSYVPKAHPSLGYFSPSTLGAWIILGAALFLLVFSSLAFSWWALRLYSEGPRWLTRRSWITPRVKSNRERKIFKITSVANAIMLSTFLGVHALTNPNLWTIDLTVISWIIFMLSLISVNLLLYRYSKKHANRPMEELKP